MQLRPYQIIAVEEICQNWHTHDHVLLQGPTGSGKTAIAKSIIENSGVQTLFVVHRKELLDQNQEIFNSNTNVTIAMVQSLKKFDLSKYELIVIDEAHHASSKSYGQLFTTDTKILGLTATPKRLDGRPLGDKFDVLIKGPTIQTLINDGFLARPEIYVPSKTAQLVSEHEGEWKVTGGDYNKKSIQQFFADNQKLIHGDVLEHYKQLAADKHTIVFCPNVKSVYETVELFRSEGILVEGIDGLLNPQERKLVVDRFKQFQTKCLVSCDLISEGFDLPDAYAAIMLRPTKSLTVYLQQAGRVLRMKENKHKCVIIDHVNNTSHFGPPWLPRHWSLEGYGQRKVRDQLTGVNLKLCLRCGNYIANSKLICHHCGYIFKTKSKLFKTIKENLECITIESAQKLIEDQCQKILNKEKWKMLKTKEDFVQFATEKGWANPEGWADKKLAEKQANDKVFFEGSREELIVMFSKRKDVSDPIKKADETLEKRSGLRKRNPVYESGTLEEIIADVKANKPQINNPEAYAAGVIRKRTNAVLEHGTEEQKAEAKKLVSGVDLNGSHTASAASVTGLGAEDKFTKMVKFAKSGNMNKTDSDGTPILDEAGKPIPLIMTDEEAEKFARNVVRKQVKPDLDSGDPVRVRAAVEKLHVKNVDAYVQTILSGDK